MRRFAKIFGIAVMASALALVTGCEKKSGGTMKSVRLATNPFVGNAPIYVAIDKGFFKECGIDFSYVDFDESGSSCSALISGNVDMAYVTLDAALIAQSQEKNEKFAVAMVIDESCGADGILVKPEIKSIADLKGKTVGVSINQTTHYLLLKALNKAGVSDTDLKLVDMSSSDAGVSFITGELDAAVTWEPYLSNAVSSGAGTMIFSSRDAPGAIVDVVVVRAGDSDAEWLKAFKTAYDKGLAFVNAAETRKEAMKIVAKYLETSVEETEAMIDTVKLYDTDSSKKALSKDQVAYNAVRDVSEFYFEKGIISAKILPEDIIK